MNGTGVARLIARVGALSLATAAVAAAAAAVMSGPAAAFSVGIGAAVALASFSVLCLSASCAAGSGFGAAFVAALGILKMAIIGALLWWLISRGLVEPVSFLAGFTSLVAALLIEGLLAGRRRARAGGR